MSIELLNPRNPVERNAVAALHLELLADSPVVQMGRRFLRDFYYGTLVEDRLIDCTLCRADGRIAGFISYTRYPLDFMTRGMRRHFFRLAGLMGISILARPAMLKDLLLVARMMRDRGREAREAPNPATGEVLSLVAAHEYRNHVPQGGKSRVPVRLFEEMVSFFRAEGFSRVHLLVKPENKASNIFCSVMGCKFEKIAQAGMPIHRYTYEINPAVAGRERGPAPPPAAS